MPTIAAARIAAQQLFDAFPALLDDRLAAHPLFTGLAEEGVRGVRVRNASDGRPSVERAISALVAGAAGVGTFGIVFNAVPCTAIDAIDAAFSEDGEPRAPERTIRSILLRYGAGANVILVEGLNHCWERFATCKELSHVLLGDPHKLRTIDVETQLRQALDIVRDPNVDRELNSEELAWFTAMEILLPTCDRPGIVGRRRQGEDTMNLARAYQVPKAIVDLLLESHSL